MKNIFIIFKRIEIWLLISIILTSFSINEEIPVKGKIIVFENNKIILFKENTILCFNEKLKLIWEKNCEENIQDISVSDNRIYVLLGKSIIVFSSDGYKRGELSLNEFYNKISIGKNITVLYDNRKKNINIYQIDDFNNLINSIGPIDIDIIRRDIHGNMYLLSNNDLLLLNNKKTKLINTFSEYIYDFYVYNDNIFAISSRGLLENNSIIKTLKDVSNICVIDNKIVIMKNGELLFLK